MALINILKKTYLAFQDHVSIKTALYQDSSDRKVVTATKRYYATA